MKNKILIFLLVGIMLVSLAACGKKEDEKVVNIYNWGEYIDEDLLSKFEEETGIKVNYDTFVTNEDLYVKLKNSNVSYDLLIPSDYMIERMVQEDMLQKINFENIPNYQNIDPEFKDKEFDPNNEYSVPYFWGTLGLVYNKDHIKEDIDSWHALWDEKYKDKIIMMDSSRDAIGLTLIKLGYSLNSEDEAELNKAKEELVKQKDLVRAYQLDETRDIMINEEASIAVMYSGDAALAISESPSLDYVIPKEGSNIFIDSMVIPKNAENKENAEAFINFMLEENNAAQNASIGYSTPISKAKDLLEDQMKNNHAAYPDLSKYTKLETFKNPGEKVKIYDDIWQSIIAN
ncbi:MAG: spermidine/putrescine ABC transporter substrate-binding protein [Tissierellia bacterium]|nr:spermidine/putrescine ABC transporter substrate-binding protein [Tissierellia bacterium]